ncbi:MAG TPA: AbrB/MazE/SpoVT family DNA-binding domain-containing protein [Blastocatellia bacterium]|nr:AbrB/MazE/SpoVT family DNA-binding domain-containing protein [Blastocatellia bacterium]
MQTEIEKSANGLVIRIPQSIVAESHIEAGSMVDVTLSEGKLTIAPVPAPAYSLDELLAQVTEDNLQPEVPTGGPTGKEDS